ncbi:MAG: hypothetical protein ACLGXA_20570, partial [Acidobacteriota bacterium]
DDQKNADRFVFDASTQILQLYPALDLTPHTRAQRVLALRKIARARLTGCTGASASAPAQLASLVSRWDQLPSRTTVFNLEQQPDLEQTIIQLAYDTETATAGVCGAPTGDDNWLLQIARNPAAVEQQ